MSTARDLILGRVRAAVAALERVAHPGDFVSAHPRTDASVDLHPRRSSAALFRKKLKQAGGETVSMADWDETRDWIAELAAAHAPVVAGAAVPAGLVEPTPGSTPSQAGLAVSMAACAVAETGSVLLDARDGRRTQLLAPIHVVLVREDAIFETLAEALTCASADLPSALGLHSGPSKSADIGQVVVKGVHGPGRLIVGVVAIAPASNPS